ncbi:MAG: hypothetical protein C4554_10535 [Dethiobacter sp.]|jgi:hypothetical protein|nr:MAG: hypothetical protein C4554_10535 [Dethiobacter sp.]
MPEEKMERKEFFKFLAGSVSKTGYKYLDSFFEMNLIFGEKWVKAIHQGELQSLPKMILLNGKWLFLQGEGKLSFKAVCPKDNAFLQHQLPANHLFCPRCFRLYDSFTGHCLLKGEDNISLESIHVKITEEGGFVNLKNT